MNALRSQLNRWLAYLGPAGVIGLGLLVFGANFYWLATQPSKIRLAQLRATAAMLQTRANELKQGRAAPMVNPLTRIAGYYESFPAPASLPQAIGEIIDTANQHALALGQADYSYEQSQSTFMGSYQMSFVVKAPYPRIRGFIRQVLADHPSLSLDEITLQRDGITALEAQAKLRLTFHVWTGEWNFQKPNAG